MSKYLCKIQVGSKIRNLGEYKMIKMLDRRDFLKLNLYIFIHSLFSKAFGSAGSIGKNQFEMLDTLLGLDFSDAVKKEIAMRVGLQKKYGYGPDGKLVPFDRFIKENANFILYKGNLRDIQMYSDVVKSHVDYMIIRSAFHNKPQEMDYFIHKLIGVDNQIYAKAILASLDNKSLDVFCRLMHNNPIIDTKTTDTIYEILTSERYLPEIGKLENLLPNLASKQKKAVLPKFSFPKIDLEKVASLLEDNSQVVANVSECIRFCLGMMQEQGKLERFDVNIKHEKVYATTFSEAYPVTFLAEINELFSTYLPMELIEIIDSYDTLAIECR